MVVGICSIMKDTPAAYLNEWLVWHRLIGVNYFFLYDNDSEIPIVDTVKDKTGVIIYQWKGLIQQLPVYNNCIEKQNKKQTPKCDWIAFIDDDEFIVIEEGEIKPFLATITESGIGLNWINFGAGNPREKGLVSGITSCLTVKAEVNKHIKSIVRPEKVRGWHHPHFCKFKTGKIIDVFGNTVLGAFVETPVQQRAWINHYYCKSVEDFELKVKKGRCDSPIHYNMSQYHSMVKEAVEVNTKIINIQMGLKAKQVVQMRDTNGIRGIKALIAKINETQDTSEMTMVEIGSYQGESTVLFAKHFKKVIAVDPFIDMYDPKDPTCHEASMTLVYQAFKNRIKEFENIEVIRDFSDNALKFISEVDFVYIDGNHTYEQVKKDIENYIPKSRCFIGGHDYVEAPHLGVIQAVDEVFTAPDFTFQDHSWLKVLPKKEIPKDTIALITPTGGREKQIELCAKYMKAQTYPGKVLWVIVDDCVPKTTESIKQGFKDNWDIIHVNPAPVWRAGQNTQSRNLKAAINEVKKHEVSEIFIIEDDDWYSPEYLNVMREKLKGFQVAGEALTYYFNVEIKDGYRNQNHKHSSLFQTAFKTSALPAFERAIQNQKFIDLDFFRSLPSGVVNLFEGGDLAVGIKGLPGRAGIGSGHNIRSFKKPETTVFERLQILKKMIGKDYLNYI